MTRRLLSDEQDTYLRSIAEGKSVNECTEKLNHHFGTSFTNSQIRYYKSNHNIRSGKKPWEFVDHTKQRLVTMEQDTFIRENAKGIGNEELTKLFNTTFKTKFTTKQIKSYKLNHGISSGLTGHFAKGHTPVNKGLTWDEYMPKESQQGSMKTTFKKGNIPPNYHPIGTEMEREDGYTYVKVSDAIEPGMSRKGWRLKHQLLWEECNGPIPEGHKIVFANGDTKDIRIDNLVLVADSELLIMNRQGLIHEDSELTKVGANVAKLIDKTNKLQGGNK
ncbi:MAG: HNH endonuclease signature motif containing protein [Coprobacillaceae bacterium]